jgi:hypothetical protein
MLALVGRERTGPDLPSGLKDSLQRRAADPERVDDLIVGLPLSDQRDRPLFSVDADPLLAPPSVSDPGAGRRAGSLRVEILS